MTCLYCEGHLTRQLIPHSLNRQGYHLILDQVPAWVCDSCGEILLDEEAAEAIQAMLLEVDVRNETLVAISAAT